MQRLPIPQGENRAGPMDEQVGPKVRVQPPQPRQEPRAVAPWLKPASEKFLKKNPPVFEGTMDPTVAKEWISMIEKILEFIQIDDEDKVKCAVYMLRKDTKIWWDAVKKTCDTATMTWAEFLIEFNSKYYIQAVINNKVVEFTRLQQESVSVLEYV